MKNLFLKLLVCSSLTFASTLDLVQAQIVGPPGSMTIDPSGKGAVNRRLALAIGKSVAIDLPREAKDIMIANPAIANATVRSATKIFIIGVAIGQTNVHVLDSDGRQIVGFDVEIGRDLIALRSALKQVLPESTIAVEGLGEGVVLSGAVQTPLDAQKAVEIAGRLIGDPLRVVNALSIRGKDQVHLKVTVAEIQRTALKQLGVNLGGVLNAGSGSIGLVTNNSYPITGKDPINVLTSALTRGTSSLTSTLKFMESNALLRTLAEPTLTAISGESAKFLAGGEYPIPSGRDRDGNITMEFKSFGVSLVFTPVVLSEGRISLKVGTEVSELSAENSLEIGGIKVPGLKVRRADSTLELPSGGTMVMAGMIQESTKRSIERMPGLGNIPVLGALFRSNDFQRQQTELVIMVTPYIVNPISANALARPTDGFEETDDASSYLFGKFNTTNSVKFQGLQEAPRARYRQNHAGTVGHIKD